jgi:predicted glycosyltransferase
LRNLARSSVLNKPGEWFVNRSIRNFDEIWVPDTADHALSGKLTGLSSEKIHFVGHLSDQQYERREKVYEIAAILSGPEPQRTHLEVEVLSQLETRSQPCVLMRGVIEEVPSKQSGHITTHAYGDRRTVNDLLNRSKIVVCRAGYSSIMDLLQVGTKAILIPTPGQPEQEYLGERLQGHPQFVVQRQGKVNLKAGIEVLMQRPEIQPHRSNHGRLIFGRDRNEQPTREAHLRRQVRGRGRHRSNRRRDRLVALPLGG